MPLRHLTALLLVALAAALAACGGGSEDDAKALLKRAFSSQIESANVTVDVSAKVEGVPQLEQPVRLKLGGPYKSNGPKSIPSLNWDVSVSGGGQTFSAGLISTGDEAFVNFQGTNYQVDDATMQQLKEGAAQSPSGNKSFKDFGVDPLAWIKNSSEEDDSDVAGVKTTHVTGDIDVERLFTDLNKVVQRAGGAVGQAKPQQLTPELIDQIKQVVKDPTFDVYVGEQDKKIRRTSLSMDFDVPEDAQGSARGLKGGTLDISVEFAGVGEPQTIAAPANAKPISELAAQLQGLGGALGATGGIGGGSGGDSGSSDSPGGGLPGGTPGGAPGTPEGGGRSPSQEQFKRYADCLNDADPSDTAAIQRCSDLLE